MSALTQSTALELTNLILLRATALPDGSGDTYLPDDIAAKLLTDEYGDARR